MASFDFSCDLLRSFAAISSSGTHWRNVANRTSANLLMYGNPGHFCLATHFVSPLHPVPPNDTPKMAIFIQGMRNMLRSLQKMLSFKCLIINTVSLVTVCQRRLHVAPAVAEAMVGRLTTIPLTNLAPFSDLCINMAFPAMLCGGN